MIVRYDAFENYMFSRDSSGISGWNVIWGSSYELYVFTVFFTGARLNNLILQHNGMTNSGVLVEISCFVTSN